MKTSLAILTLVSFSLAGCQSTREIIVARCPPLKQYSLETQHRLAAELRILPKDALLGKVIVDYKALRDACRVSVEQ